MKKYFILSILFVVLLLARFATAQCDCVGCDCQGPCNSGCQCGCNSSANAAPPTEGAPPYDSLNVEFLSQLTLAQLNAGQGVLGNDCWGWTHTASGREFAIFGMTNATAFIEITDPTNPVHVGTLPGAGGNDVWRDIKVYNNRAYIVADGSENSSHGVQVFELNRLLGVKSPPEQFTEDARYQGLGRAHNIAINTKTGFAYVVGSSSQSSAGGPIILNLKDGVLPVLVGTYSGDDYTHDIQVVKYHGPDIDDILSQVPTRRSLRREIAFCSNTDTLTIVDVTNKSQPKLISRSPYNESGYSHQGWLTEDHKFFFMDDELDELQLGPIPTRTHVWDVCDLDAPTYVGFVNGTANTIDHNLYVHGNHIFQANYTSGLRILKINNPLTLDIPVVGYFDTYQPDNAISFNGAWSCYPFFPSGNIIISDRQGGLFVVRFDPTGSAQIPGE